MNSNNLSIAVEFDLSATPDVFNVTDNGLYSGVTATNKLGNVKVIAPNGTTIHNNVSYVSPDINYNSSTTSANFPLTVLVAGNYTFIYTVKLVNELQSIPIASNNSVAKTIELAGNYTTLINDGTATAFNCVDVVTTSLTIVSATYNSSTGYTTVTVGQTLGTLLPSALFQFTVDTIATKTFTAAYSYTAPNICLEWEQDECCSSMTITDVTAYPSGSTVTRLHTVSYPDGMVTPIADIESPLQELTITPIWTGTWTDVFTADIQFTSGILTIVDSLRGVKEFKVSTDTYSCQIYSCYKAIVNKYADQLVTAPGLAVKTANWLTLATGVLNAYNLGKKCGKTDYVDFLAQITSIASNCGCSCDCEDCANDTPVQVVGCCGNVGGSDFTIVLDSPNGSISISSVTVGTTTTFSIDVDGTWFTTEINNTLAVTSINALSDVDTASVPPTNGQVLVWDTVNWVPGTVPQTLVTLADVDDTGLADGMVLYWDNGAGLFKFSLVTSSIAGATDVQLTGLANKDILQWNGSKWVNVDNFLSLLTDVTLTSLTNKDILQWNGSAWVNVENKLSLLSDVNTAGLTNGVALKWNTGTSKWIVFTPKTTLASLDDCTIPFATALTENDILKYVTGSGWVNSPPATFTIEDNSSFNPGVFDNSVAGLFPVGIRYDSITGSVTIRGAADNLGGAVVAQTTIFTIANSTLWPANEVTFLCTVGLNATPTVGGGSVSAAGVVSIAWHMDATTGARTVGYPAGDISLDQVPTWFV